MQISLYIVAILSLGVLQISCAVEQSLEGSTRGARRGAMEIDERVLHHKGSKGGDGGGGDKSSKGDGGGGDKSSKGGSNKSSKGGVLGESCSSREDCGSSGDDDIFCDFVPGDDVEGKVCCIRDGRFCQENTDCCGEEVCQSTIIGMICSCFPTDATVDVLGKGLVTMEQLAVGDKVLGSDGYSTVYGFGHGTKTIGGKYVQLKTDSSQTIELSDMHMVFTIDAMSRKKVAKSAVHVKVGDLVVLATKSDKEKLATVTSIKEVAKEGLYNPYTQSGDLFVNGVLASCYSISPHVSVGKHELVSKHTFKYMVYAVPRVVCQVNPGWAPCRHDETGRLSFTTLVDDALFWMVPGLESGQANFLAWSPTLPINMAVLFLWILPVYALEQYGFTVLSMITAIWFLVNKKKIRTNKQTVKTMD